MTQEQIDIGSKLLAKFEGHNVVLGEEPFVPYAPPYGMSDEEFESELLLAQAKHAEWEFYNRPQYIESYEWLMRAWVKFRDLDIESVALNKKLNQYHFEYFHKEWCVKTAHAIAYQPIEVAFERLVESVSWWQSATENKTDSHGDD